MKVMKNNFLKFLWVRIVVYAGLLGPATFSLLILEIVKVVYIGIKIPTTLPQIIVYVVDVGKL